MVVYKTIKVEVKVKDVLDKLKIHKRETYSDVIKRIIEENKNLKKRVEELERENKELEVILKEYEMKKWML